MLSSQRLKLNLEALHTDWLTSTRQLMISYTSKVPRWPLGCLWPPCVADADIIFLPCGFFLFSFLVWSQQPQIGCLPYFYTWCGHSANLECRSEMCCTRLAGNTGCKKIATRTPSHNFVGPYLRNEGKYRQLEKKLVKQQYLPHMSSQYGGWTLAH